MIFYSVIFELRLNLISIQYAIPFIPCIANTLRSLRLSVKGNTPELIALFLFRSLFSLLNNIWISMMYVQSTVFSSTLEVLSINNMRCDLREVISLVEHTPHLRYLDITINETNRYVFNDYDMLFPEHDQITKLCFLNQYNQMLYEHATIDDTNIQSFENPRYLMFIFNWIQ